MKKFILLLAVLLAFSNANASHLLGGEITWQCLTSGPNQGEYIFTMKLYRDCDGITLSTAAQTLEMWGAGAPFTTITLDFDTVIDISPLCDVQNSGYAALDCVNNPIGAVEEYIYISQPIAIVGLPPLAGWHFTWDSCCRPGSVINLANATSAGYTLRASMFPYFVNGIQVPVGPCFDSSPIFNESPNTIICTGYPFAYSHNASDSELDSIAYQWAEPLDDFFGAYNPPVLPAPLPFVAPYTFNSPIPSISAGGVQLDPITGEISYHSNIAGTFATTISVKAFKCGQLVSEIFRDIPAVLINCGALASGGQNNPPIVTAPLGNQTWTQTIGTSGLPSYATTINAGELVTFDILANDADLYTGGIPQDLTMTISGGQVTPCNNPPCATFTDVNGNTTITAASLVSGMFSWQTDCAQILSAAGCGNTTNIFTFLVKVVDDFCPANAIRIATIKITVLPATTQPAPLFQCVTENSLGDVSITWNHHPTANSSTSYNIYASDNISGPFNLLSTVNYPADLTSIAGANIPLGTQYYYMTLESLCASTSESSDTITPIQLDISSSNVNCWDDSDGRIAINMLSNVITPFTYILDGIPNPLPFPSDSVFSGLSTGTYSVTITDSASCFINEQIIITAPNSPLQALTTGDVGLCHADSTSISVAYAIGGTGPYNYLWYSSVGGLPSSIISFTDTAFGLSSGIYFAEVTDANGCDTVSSVQVLSANTALFSTTQVGQVICKGDYSGYLIADAGGGFAPYTYIWSTSLSGVIQTSSSAYNRDTLNDLSSGIYLLDIVDHFGCTVSQTSHTVNEPIQPLVLDTIYLIDSIACFGDNDGRALGVKSGGDPSYIYLWDNGESTLLANNLTSGYHTLSVVDDRGCEVLDSIYIPESSEIISSLVIEESISCYGSTNGFVSVSTVGGYPLYLYSWSNNQPLDTGIVDTAFGLSYGVYSLTTEDSLGCSVVDSVYLSEPGLLTMEAKELSWISCNGILDGLAFSAAYGGTLPYTFVWDNNQIGDTVNTLSPGLHTVIVTDARGCVASDTVLIHEPPLLTVGISVLDSVYCNGVNTGSLATYVLGGTPFVGTSSLYTYLWDDALQASQTTAIATNLSADVYTVVVTDFRGCTAIATTDITSVTNTMSVSATSTNVSCYGSADGSTSVFASGGHAPYSYNWVGNNGLSLSILSSIQNLLAGTYSVTVSDTNNCTRNTSVDIIEPLGILFDIAGSLDESCVGACDGLIYINSLSGGTSPYSALLTNNLTGLVTQHAIQSNTILDVCSGAYTISLTDANECSSSVLFSGNNQAIVNSVVTLPTPSISLVNNILCYGSGTGELMVISPDPNYTYIWEDLSDPTFNSSSAIASNLFAGNYIVTVQYTDSLGQLLTGCNVSSDTLILLDGAEIFITETLHTDVLCHGDNTGVISVFASGGSGANYTYTWNPSQATNTTLVNLLAGNYTLTIEDGNNCEQSSVFTIVEPQALNVNITQNGYVLTTSNPTGGIAPYSYSWREQSQPNVHLQAGVSYNVYSTGTYYLQVTDGNGCEMNSNSFEYIETGISQVSFDIVLSIYPNPFKDETTVDFGRVVNQASVRVVDVFGKLIEEHSILNTDKHILKRENKASGIYFVEIEVEDLLIKEKLIIE